MPFPRAAALAALMSLAVVAPAAANCGAEGCPLSPEHVLAHVNFLHHGRDDVGNTDAEPEHTGGESVFITPGLRAALPGGATVYGYYQVRAYEHSNGPQLVAQDHLIFGATFGLGR